MLRVWNLSLVCATFALTILGTFLTRSGVLDSVHAFSDSLDRPDAARLLRPRRAGDVRAHRLAGRRAALAGAHRLRRQPRGQRSSSTTCSSPPSRSWCCSARCSRSLRRGDHRRPRHRRRAVLRHHGHAHRPGPAVPHGRGAGAAVAQGVARRPSPPASTGRPGSAPAAHCVVAVLLGRPRLSAPLLAFGLGGFAAGAAGRQVVLATRRQGWRGLVGRANGGMVVHLGVVAHRRRAGRVAELRHRARVTLERGRHRRGRRPHRRARRHLRQEDDPAGQRVQGPGAHRRRAGLRAGHLAVPQRRPGHRHAVGAHRPQPRTSTCRCCPAPTSRTGVVSPPGDRRSP